MDKFSHGYYSNTVKYNIINTEDFLDIVDMSNGGYESDFVPRKKHFAGIKLNLINLPYQKRDKGFITFR